MLMDRWIDLATELSNLRLPTSAPDPTENLALSS